MAQNQTEITKVASSTTEIVKAGLRVVVIGIVSFFATGGTDMLFKAYGGGLTPEQVVFWTTFLTMIATSIDKKMHDEGKKIEETTGEKSKLTTGLTRF